MSRPGCVCVCANVRAVWCVCMCLRVCVCVCAGGKGVRCARTLPLPLNLKGALAVTEECGPAAAPLALTEGMFHRMHVAPSVAGRHMAHGMHAAYDVCGGRQSAAWDACMPHHLRGGLRCVCAHVAHPLCTSTWGTSCTQSSRRAPNLQPHPHRTPRPHPSHPLPRVAPMPVPALQPRAMPPLKPACPCTRNPMHAPNRAQRPLWRPP